MICQRMPSHDLMCHGTPDVWHDMTFNILMVLDLLRTMHSQKYWPIHFVGGWRSADVCMTATGDSGRVWWLFDVRTTQGVTIPVKLVCTDKGKCVIQLPTMFQPCSNHLRFWSPPCFNHVSTISVWVPTMFQPCFNHLRFGLYHVSTMFQPSRVWGSTMFQPCFNHLRFAIYHVSTMFQPSQFQWRI